MQDKEVVGRVEYKQAYATGSFHKMPLIKYVIISYLFIVSLIFWLFFPSRLYSMILNLFNHDFYFAIKFELCVISFTFPSLPFLSHTFLISLILLFLPFLLLFPLRVILLLTSIPLFLTYILSVNFNCLFYTFFSYLLFHIPWSSFLYDLLIVPSPSHSFPTSTCEFNVTFKSTFLSCRHWSYFRVPFDYLLYLYFSFNFPFHYPLFSFPPTQFRKCFACHWRNWFYRSWP